MVYIFYKLQRIKNTNINAICQFENNLSFLPDMFLEDVASYLHRQQILFVFLKLLTVIIEQASKLQTKIVCNIHLSCRNIDP